MLFGVSHFKGLLIQQLDRLEGNVRCGVDSCGSFGDLPEVPT